MNFHYLQNLHFLTFEGNPATVHPVGKHLKLTTSPEMVQAMLDQIFAPGMNPGTIEGAKKCAAHLNLWAENSTFALNDAQVTNFTETLMQEVPWFLEALWLVKDHSGSAGTGLVVYSNDDGCRHHRHFPHSEVNCESNGLQSEKVFTAAELARALAFHTQLVVLAPRGEFLVGSPKPSMTTHGSRLGRALFWIQPARATSHVEMKVVNYCMCLESLFSTDVHLISQRVSERIARLIGSGGAEQRQVFGDVVDLYNLRSKVVHGTRLSGVKVGEMRKLAIAVDDYLRRALVRLIDDDILRVIFSDPDDKDDKRLKEYFMNQLFPT